MSYRKIIFILCLSIFLSAERNASAQSQTFSYTGSVQTWVVPCNVTSITIDCYGAQGIGVSPENHPGYGGEARGVMSVLPGEVLYLYVGGQAGWNGGGLGLNGANGGDGTDVRYNGQALSNRIIVAGGGGGSGGDNWNCTSGVYGNGGGGIIVGSNFVGGGGGEGYSPGTGCGTNGGTNGGNGGTGCDGGGGGGGGMTSGGLGATVTCASPPNDTAGRGTLGHGGISFTGPGCNGEGTGAGGGGYYGGGGAGGYTCGAGQGGGGSSWTGSLTSPYFNYGSWTGNGQIIITKNNVPTPVTDTARLVNNVSCNGGHDGKARAVVSGGLLSTFTFSWAPAGGSRDTATGLSAGTYTVTATDACALTATSTVTLIQPAPLTDSTYIIRDVFCHGGNDGSAGALGKHGDLSSSYTYAWTPIGQNTAVATGLSAGSYTVTVTDLCGGTSSSAVTITQPNPLAVAASVTADISCHGANNGSGWAQVNSGTPPYRYTWSPNGSTLDSIVGLSAGTYSVQVSDRNGCTGSATITITQPTVLDFSIATTNNVLCNGGTDGAISSNANGGSSPYTYSWSDGETTANASGLTAGRYTLTLTDAHGCVVLHSSSVTQPAALVVVKELTPSDTGCTGSTWVMVNGGVLPYTYLWNNGNKTAYNYGVCDSTYCCKVTDMNGCTQTVCADVYSDLGVGNISNNGSGKVLVYPNPNNGQFTIVSSASNQWTVEVYNILGAKVYTQSNIQASTYNVNLADQANGVYLYRVISSVNGALIGQGKISVQK